MSCVSQQVEHWVVRLIRHCGLCHLGWNADANMFVCTQTFGNDGKGATAHRNGLGLTHMVDNHLECLWSVVADHHGNQSATLEVEGWC